LSICVAKKKGVPQRVLEKKKEERKEEY
jgi:hypothetical protein